MPDLSQLVTRLSSALQIGHAEASQLAQQLAPVVVVDAIDQIGDSADVATRWALQTGFADGAALIANVALSNPVGSGMRLIVARHYLSSGTAGTITAGIRTPIDTLTTAVQGLYRDSGPGSPAGIVHEGNLAAGPTASFAVAIVADVPNIYEYEVVIDPGFQWVWFPGATARTLRTTFEWKEIKLPEVA